MPSRRACILSVCVCMYASCICSTFYVRHRKAVEKRKESGLSAACINTDTRMRSWEPFLWGSGRCVAVVVLYSWRQRKQMHAPSQEKGKGMMRCTGALWRLCVYVFLFCFCFWVWCSVEKGGWPTTTHSNASRSSRCSSSSPSPSSTISIMAGMTGCPCWIFQYPSITIGAA